MDLFGSKKASICTSQQNNNDNGIITKKYSDGGYLKQYNDGTTERVRFTKTREVHDFDGPKGKGIVWSKRK